MASNGVDPLNEVSEPIDENSPLLTAPNRCSYVSSLSENHFGESPRIRKPFHYGLQENNVIDINFDVDSLPSASTSVNGIGIGINSMVDDVQVDSRPMVAATATFHRLRYYNRLRSSTDQTLGIPDHVVPSMFFYGIPNPTPIPKKSIGGTQSSLVTIFVIWNTMVGTSLLSMPWAVTHAGLTFGMILMVLMASLCFYTAFRILCVQNYVMGSSDDSAADFSIVCDFLIGRWGSLASIFFSLCSLLGASIVCWILITNFFYYIVLYLHDIIFIEPLWPAENHTQFVLCPLNESNSTSSHGGKDLFYRLWDLRMTVPLVMVVILGPLINVRSPHFFAKFSALGTFSVVFLMCFIGTKAITWGIHVDFDDRSSSYYVPHFKGTFVALTGTLSMSLFIHNCILSIVQNQRNPENNTRDLGIAYVLVTATYMFIGGLFYTTFPLDKSCIAQNLLNNIDANDPMAFFVRVFLFFQVLTVCPLLFYIFRVQFMYHVFGSIYPGCKHVFVLNVCLIAIGVLFAIFMPSIGTIIRFVGAFCGLAYVFILPCLTYLTALNERHKTESGKLSRFNIGIHALIIVFGVTNFIAQFIVQV